jgi:Tfp pilus assembly protein PilV
MRPFFRLQRPSLRSQRGGILIEVMFAAVALAAVSTAVFSGVDGAVKTATKNRVRSIAATLAEQDQERMRSFKATELSNYRETRTVTVKSVPYTVTSSTQWLRDGSGTISCTNDSTGASYLKLISTAAPVGGRTGSAVTSTSLLTPPNGAFAAGMGTLAVQLTDRAGAPRPGLTVNDNGPSTAASDTTNEVGCAVFPGVAAGTHTVTVAAPGLVDRSGNSNISQSAGVVDGATTLLTIELEVPSRIDVSFDTKVGAAAAVAAAARAATVANPGLPAPGLKTVSVTMPASPNTISFPTLYPFTGGYGTFAGQCAANDPTTYSANYYSSNPGLVSVTPGGTFAVTVRVPAINIVVRNASNQILSNARVFVTPTDTGCGAAYPMQLTNSSGAMPKPGHPFGNYSVCADDNNLHSKTVAIVNTSAAGTATTTITLPASSGGGNGGNGNGGNGGGTGNCP